MSNGTISGHVFAWLLKKRVEILLWHAKAPRWQFLASFVLAHVLAALSWGWVFDPLPLVDEAFTLLGLATVWQAALGRMGVIALPAPQEAQKLPKDDEDDSEDSSPDST